MMNGKIYLLPVFTSRRPAYMMFYNKDVLSKAGFTEKDIPKDWASFLKFCQEIQQKTNGQSYGVVLGLKTNWVASSCIAQMASAISPEVVDTNDVGPG